MNLFISSAKIIDPTSKHHLQTKDIIIQNGKITGIGKDLKNKENFKEVTSKSLCVSPGWLDMFSYFADPGFEHKEDITTGIRAASAGGFTAVCCMPNTNPALHSKSEIEYVLNKAKGSIVDVMPLGAISRNCEGNDIAEIYDMKQAGAAAFSDGIHSSVSAGLMLRSLLYVKPFNGLVISHPDDKSIRNEGIVNEGKMSTVLGMTGIPPISEEIIVMRDINLAEYSDSRVHFAYVSSAGSLDLIKKAKTRGVKVTCSVSPYNLLLDDSLLSEYDTNYKVLPPLKNKSDQVHLIKGLKDGVIDVISSMHIPQDSESKNVEFDFAEFGMLGLETAYAMVKTALGEKIAEEIIVEKMAINPRKILQLDIPAMEQDAIANLTLFDNQEKWKFTASDIKSKSKNTPFVGHAFVGKVLGIVNHNQLHLN